MLILPGAAVVLVVDRHAVLNAPRVCSIFLSIDVLLLLLDATHSNTSVKESSSGPRPVTHPWTTAR
jgi:hypothetical protein